MDSKYRILALDADRVIFKGCSAKFEKGFAEAFLKLETKFDKIYVISFNAFERKAQIIRLLRGLVPANRCYFTSNRQDKAKIAKQLKVTHFVDDRWEVLEHMVGLAIKLYLFNPHKTTPYKFESNLAEVVYGWDELFDLLTKEV